MPKNQDVIAIYSRKSRFTGKGESIGNQVELCRAYIRTAFGDAYADGAVVFEDEGFSGGNLNRPDFKRMMKAARDHQFKAVVVYRLDRISRNISDFSALIEELGRLEIDFVSIRESFDTSSPMGRAMMYIASVFSQLERETIAERIRDNMHELAKTGRWLGGTTPTGYTSEAVKTITVDGKSKRACKLKVIPEEADIVRKIYDLYIETDSLTMTEAELLRQHIKTKTGRNFTRFSIRGILQNPVYLIADQDAWLQDMAVETAGDMISANPDLDIIYAANDGGTVGSVMAVENAGKAGELFVFGTDGSEQIVDLLKDDTNILQAVTAQDAYAIGYSTVEALINSLEGNPVEGEGETNIIPGIPLVRGDTESLDTYLADLQSMM